MAEIGLIVLSVAIMSRYRKAGEPGGGRYVWGIWLTWLAAVIVASVAGVQTGSEGLIYGLVLVGYVICFIIAANGMRSGRQYLENYEAMRQREREKEQERQIERQVQTRVDAAVAAALAQYQRQQAAQAAPPAETADPAALESAPVVTTTPAMTSPAPREAPVPVMPEVSTASSPAPSVTASNPNGKFYVFAAQGPAFGAGFTGDVAMEKAMKLKGDYPPARSMDLVLVRPGEWSAPISASSAGGIISASFSLDDHRGEIEKHLLQLGVSSGEDRGGPAGEQDPFAAADESHVRAVRDGDPHRVKECVKKTPQLFIGEAAASFCIVCSLGLGSYALADSARGEERDECPYQSRSNPRLPRERYWRSKSTKPCR